MAKKRRKEEQKEEEKYEFKPPDFDEKAFLEKDITATKTLFVSSLVAVVLGIIAFLLTGFSPLLGIVVIFAGALLLRYIYHFFKLEFAAIDKKTVLGNYILLIFLALGIWIILLNPPFSDMHGPEIMDQNIYFTHNNETILYDQFRSINVGDETNITAVFRDNGVLASIKVEIHMSGGDVGEYHDMSPNGTYGKYEYKTQFSTPGTYTYSFLVTDGAGRTLDTFPGDSFNVVV
jgi:hypothetical protein